MKIKMNTTYLFGGDELFSSSFFCRFKTGREREKERKKKNGIVIYVKKGK